MSSCHLNVSQSHSAVSSTRESLPLSGSRDEAHAEHPFPPPRLRNHDIAAIITDWCDASDARSIAETACAVCGELVPASSVTRICCESLDLSVLNRIGVSTVAHGPVLFEDGVFHNPGTYADELDACSQCLLV